MTEIMKLAVITGDHAATDSTKLGATYGAEDLVAHGAMVAAFQSLGRFEITVFNTHRDLLVRLVEAKPDIVVNFCDTGLGNQPSRELHVPAMLEVEGIPYTGACPQAMVMCFDKQVVRLVAQALGVEVPREYYLLAGDHDPILPDLYPALLKPNTADGSVGITMDAVVRDLREANRYMGFLRRELPGRDVLWQEYLPGPEYGVGLIGNPADHLEVLPPLEVDFSGLPEGLNPILSFESKVDPASPYWTEIRFNRATLSDETLTRLEGWTRMLFGRFGLRDYGRFDFRCGADGRPKLIEINPNPAWANDGKLAFMAGFAGIEYPRMLEMIVDAALTRIARRKDGRARS